jgi:predicted HAD superfamily Cof-like phosphohydrolase
MLVSAIFLLLASGYFVYGWMMQVGVDQDYEPIQPIHYSHRIHAGSNGIDCKYCHSSARVSKHAGIPSLNVCMNCHKNIAEVADSTATPEYSKAFYDAQIQKLYDAVGWDKAAQKYTGKTSPVKWVRIHNLPDFAYFNHSQHVTVAGIECQKCHGEVQTYEIQKQFAPLTMGWCIDCHRKTDVKMEGNAYYDKIHSELSKKYGVDKLTAAQMGGLECGKCHY